MQIFTSYFANLKSLPSDAVPVSIALKTPSWFSGMRYAPLAPTGEIFSAWKAHQDDDLYIRQYNQVVLSRLNPINVRKDLETTLWWKGRISSLLRKPERLLPSTPSCKMAFLLWGLRHGVGRGRDDGCRMGTNEFSSLKTNLWQY